jgi:hypothetical protein
VSNVTNNNKNLLEFNTNLHRKSVHKKAKKHKKLSSEIQENNYQILDEYESNKISHKREK